MQIRTINASLQLILSSVHAAATESLAPWPRSWMLPLHGGFEQSGYGKDMSLYAIEHHTELKHVMTKL